MAKRRILTGKKLLVATGVAGATVLTGCEDTATANLVAPPETGTGGTDGGGGGVDARPADATPPPADVPVIFDVPVANLVAPPDDVPDVPVIDLPDAPVANLIPPPDDAGPEPSDGGVTDAVIIDLPDAPVANLLPPPDDAATK